MIPAGRRVAVLGAFVLLAAVVVTACNGGDGGEDQDATRSLPAAAGETTDGWRVRALDELAGYRYQVAVSLLPEGLAGSADIPTGLLEPGSTLELRLEGAFQTPDREHTRISFSLGPLSLQLESIRIGDRLWSREGEGAWRETPAEAGGHPLLGELDYQPSSIFRVDESYSLPALTERLLMLAHTQETAAGMPARRYSMTPEEFREVFQSDQDVLPAEAGADATFTFDVWFSEALGVPLRMLIVGKDGQGREILRLVMDLADIDDPGIQVQPPA